MVKGLRYKAAAIQFKWDPESKDNNLEKAKVLLEEAGKEGVKLAVLQEYFATAYGRKEDAEPIPGPTTDCLRSIARRYKMYIAGGTMVEKDRNNFYSTLPFIDPTGEIIAKYRKVHILDRPGIRDESQFERGKEIPVCKTKEIGNIGLLAGVDLDTPLAPWVAARKGCEVLVVPHCCSSKYVDAHRYLLRATAWGNLIYIIAPNPVGYWKGTPEGDFYYLGGSGIISPMGEILANAGEFSDGIAIATIDISKLWEYRETMRTWKGQIVPEAYEPYLKVMIKDKF